MVKKITFTLNGKTITTDLVKEYKAKTGGGTDSMPCCEVGYRVHGGHSHQFMFEALDDRSDMGTDVLLNRFIMKTMNVMVDPQKSFIITTKQGD